MNMIIQIIGGFLFILLVLTVFIALIALIVVVPDIIIEKRDEKKRKQKELEMNSKGFYERTIQIGCGIYITKMIDDEEYYLYDDGNFYTSDSMYKYRKIFTTNEEMNDWVKEHEEKIKEKYGDNAKIKTFRIEKYLSYCKKAEE